MLLSFSVRNFKSFRDEQVLDLRARSLQPAFSWLEHAAVPVGDDEAALRVKAVYGANASGKSNLIEGLRVMLQIGLFSALHPDVLQGIDGFSFDRKIMEEPSIFELEFETDGKQRYRYGFSATGKEIVREWLFDETIRKAKVFERTGGKVSIGRRYFENKDTVDVLIKSKNEIFRPDSTLLSALRAFSGDSSAKAAISFLEKIVVITDTDQPTIEQLAYGMMTDHNLREKVVELLSFAGIDIDNVLVLDKENSDDIDLPPQMKKGLRLLPDRFVLLATYDTGGPQDDRLAWFTFEGESKGTQKMLVLAPLIVKAIEEGRIFVIDEFEAKLHTKLSREIVQLFNSKVGNPNNAQFIFSTHDTNLLDNKLLRRDQIDFVEKRADRSSEIISLADIKGTRKEDDFERDYLGGRYGAVPEVTDFNIAILED